MDLLSQYKQDNPELFQKQKQAPIADESGRAYTGMVAFLIRLSGGRIRDARQASYALLGAVMFITIAALYIFISAGGGEGYEQREVSPDQFIPGKLR